jgi:hypothetical protein
MICSCVNLDRFIIRLHPTDSSSFRLHPRGQGQLGAGCGGACTTPRITRRRVAESHKQLPIQVETAITFIIKTKNQKLDALILEHC